MNFQEISKNFYEFRMNSAVALIVRLLETDPLALVFLDLLVLIALFGRPLLLRHVKTESCHD